MIENHAGSLSRYINMYAFICVCVCICEYVCVYICTRAHVIQYKDIYDMRLFCIEKCRTGLKCNCHGFITNVLRTACTTKEKFPLKHIQYSIQIVK